MGRFPIFSARDTSRRIAEADSVAVIGLGRFGSSLALELMASGTEVLGIDNHEELVQSLNGELTQVVRADATKPEVLAQLALEEFDRVVVAIGNDVSASILTCSVLLNMKSPVIWAKAVNDQHGLILEQLGVQHVIYPEKDMGRRVAHLVRGAALDYIEVAKGYALVKAPVPGMFQNVALGATDLRKTHRVTVAAFQHGDQPWTNADNQTVLVEGDTILIVGATADAEAFAQLR
ncbi:trk system potassium uptake protein TrkA [Microbacterium endophyticum]|uniref:Trk system potassium uptake protein TrkA n=1 Tax=Microbacterium endophyticum TaxID=1526412 RepID=A0A7W4YLP2_9MICO|nr:TrkA family potassium uptake protein [Microbacterium endophyticum]MBB2974664.1 trk system potassium uptake protein TrkA [Microbacterium endophyticum]NIK36961.1 trk system potassium uptake protein TrkA [Microbacterium endophyticum]